MFRRRNKHGCAYSYFDFINGIVHLILLKEHIFYLCKPEERKMIFRCVICKKPVSIDDSYSFCGHMLICMRCFYKHFDGELHKVNEWKNEEDSVAK